MLKDRYKPFVRWGITVFLVFVCCILFFFCLLRFSELKALLGTITGILSPIIWGIAIAYLLWPIVEKIQKFLLPRLPARLGEKRRRNMSLGIGIVGALLLMILVIVVLISMVLPELVDTVMTLVNNFSTYVETVENWISGLLADNPQIQDIARTAFDNLAMWLNNWIQNDLLSQVNVVVTGLTSSVISVARFLLNFVIGIIVSIYVFVSKDTFSGQFKKLLYAVFKPEQANIILDVIHHSDKIFGGFISGKILDSLIIGILCFICLSILKMPYTILVSVVVGVTNVIPFFGPFIGAIPSAFLILVVSPQQCLIFVVFILILQQIDGNIIGPTILGDSTGLSSFWVIFSILLGGGLFGFAGMILSVPVCGVFYYIAKRLVEYRLQIRSFPVETKDYGQAGVILDPDTKTLIKAVREEEKPPVLQKRNGKKK
ncbi:MAG: AI-2E family transporter [Lachnospiraceae bacterium]|jgi:predicted PurR-regulated permease PerM|nr:AI-2E family transporter [Lachnospiraceae bacterium]